MQGLWSDVRLPYWGILNYTYRTRKIEQIKIVQQRECYILQRPNTNSTTEGMLYSVQKLYAFYKHLHCSWKSCNWEKKLGGKNDHEKYVN